jgi:branched-chain amino acid transport system permease protein
MRTDRVVLATFAIGSGLAATAGILVALDVNMRPTMGLNALMLAIVAVIIGGVGSIGGIVLGSLLLALVQQLAVWQLGSQWQDAVAFAILLVFLLARPQGFFGKPLRKVAI